MASIIQFSAKTTYLLTSKLCPSLIIKSKIHTNTANSKSFRKWYQGVWNPKRTEPPYAHITQIGDPILRLKASDVPEDSITSKEVKYLIDCMTGTLRTFKCVGLSAPQVGISLRVILMEFTENSMSAHTSEAIKAKQMEILPLTVLINPQMKVTNYAKTNFLESCESVRGYYAEVPRYDEVSVKGYDVTGRLKEMKLKGWNARILQHEMDHLNGIVYTDVMNQKSFSCTCWEAVNAREGRVYIKFQP